MPVLGIAGLAAVLVLSAAPPPRVQARTPEIRVRGAVVVVDAQGVEHSLEDGNLTIWGPWGKRDRVPVEKGRFTVDLPEEGVITSVLAKLGGRLAYIAYDRLKITQDIGLRARWLATLRVVDAKTGIDLSEVTVVACTDSRIADLAHPGRYSTDDLLVQSGRSPLALDVKSDTFGPMWDQLLWVGAPGYAWGKIELDFSNPDERLLKLHPGATTLELNVEHELPVAGKSDPLKIRLRHQLEQGRLAGLQKGLILEADAAIGFPMVFDGLAPGPVVASIEIGEWQVLGKVAVTLTAGETTRARIPVKRPVRLSGTLFLPPKWNLPELKLRFEPFDENARTASDLRPSGLVDLHPVEGTPGLYRWDAGRVLSIRQLYPLQSSGTRWMVAGFVFEWFAFDGVSGFQWLLDVGPGGTDQAKIIVAPPAEVSVRVLDETGLERSGEEISFWGIHWKMERPEEVELGKWGDRARWWGKEARRFEFRVPAGRVELTVSSHEYTTAGETVFDVQPGRNELTLRTKPACGVVLLLREGTTSIPWKDGGADIQTSEGVDAGRSYSFGEYRYSISVREPGTYQVIVPNPPGFEAIPPFTIDIPDGTFVEHKVQLRRRR